jgi:flagellar hook-basal body complex protein FliE
MDIRSIGGLTPVPTSSLARVSEGRGVGATPGAPAPGQVVEGFGQALAEAIDGLNRLQQEADAQALQLAAGEPVELHEVMLAQERASLGLQLAVQVRDKLVEAYQEIMRLQV